MRPLPVFMLPLQAALWTNAALQLAASDKCQ